MAGADKQFIIILLENLCICNSVVATSPVISPVQYCRNLLRTATGLYQSIFDQMSMLKKDYRRV